MLVIGSAALQHHGLLQEGRKIGDLDYIATLDSFRMWCKQNQPYVARCVPTSGKMFHIRTKAGFNIEFEIAFPGSSGHDLLILENAVEGYKHASLQSLYALKMSHRYKKNSPHFLKTMRDIQHLRNYITRKDERFAYSEWFKKREAETYTNNLPKLNVSKEDFFKGDGVQYVYDHDSIHLAMALLGKYNRPEVFPTPAYTFYMKEGSQVMTSKEKFFSVEEKIRLYGVYEETCVLALERSQIPHAFGKEGGPTPRWSFEKALEKVCTSITGGWFRNYAWENYDKVIELHTELGEDDYIQRFRRNAHLLKPYGGNHGMF